MIPGAESAVVPTSGEATYLRMKVTRREKQRHDRENPMDVQVLGLRYIWWIITVMGPRTHVFLYTDHGTVPSTLIQVLAT